MGRQGRPEIIPALVPFCLLTAFLFSCTGDPGLDVPAGWKRTGFGIYELKDPEKKYRETVTILNDGLQPWRSEAACAAASCLLDFGVLTGENAVSLSVRLKPIEENGLYSLTTKSERYLVTIRYYEDVPVPVQLRVTLFSE